MGIRDRGLVFTVVCVSEFTVVCVSEKWEHKSSCKEHWSLVSKYILFLLQEQQQCISTELLYINSPVKSPLHKT